MSLLDSLRKVAAHIDVGHVPTSAEANKLLGAMIAFAEHGDDVLQAAENGAEELIHLLSGSSDTLADSKQAQYEAELAQARAVLARHDAAGQGTNAPLTPAVQSVPENVPPPQTPPDPSPVSAPTSVDSGNASLSDPVPADAVPDDVDQAAQFRAFLDWQRSQVVAPAAAEVQRSNAAVESSSDPEPDNTSTSEPVNQSAAPVVP